MKKNRIIIALLCIVIIATVLSRMYSYQEGYVSSPSPSPSHSPSNSPNANPFYSKTPNYTPTYNREKLTSVLTTQKAALDKLFSTYFSKYYTNINSPSPQKSSPTTSKSPSKTTNKRDSPRITSSNGEFNRSPYYIYFRRINETMDDLLSHLKDEYDTITKDVVLDYYYTGILSIIEDLSKISVQTQFSQQESVIPMPVVLIIQDKVYNIKKEINRILKYD